MKRVPLSVSSSIDGQTFAWVVQTSETHVRLIRVTEDAPTHAGAERGAARLMSASSRRRLMYVLNRIHFGVHVNRTFITLTFPDSVDCFSYTKRTYYRNRFHVEIERHLKKRVPMVWRQEWKRRKSGERLGETMPHYHLLLLDLPFVHQRWLVSAWRRILGVYEGPCIVDVRRVYNEDGAIRYVAKYVSKLPSLDICSYLDKRMQTGRAWGVRRKHLITLRPMQETIVENPTTVDSLLAFANANLKRPRESERQGFTLYGDLATMAKRFLEKAT